MCAATLGCCCFRAWGLAPSSDSSSSIQPALSIATLQSRQIGAASAAASMSIEVCTAGFSSTVFPTVRGENMRRIHSVRASLPHLAILYNGSPSPHPTF